MKYFLLYFYFLYIVNSYLTKANHKLIAKYVQSQLAKCMMGESGTFEFGGSNLYDCGKNRGNIPSYIEKIFNETKMKISIEAASTDCWKKYIGNNGLTFGVDTFGKSAPYKEIYKYFGLTVSSIASKTKKLLGK